MVEEDNPHQEPHPAIMLVSAYIIERGKIAGARLKWKALPMKSLTQPEFIKMMALLGVVLAIEAISTQKKLVN